MDQVKEILGIVKEFGVLPFLFAFSIFIIMKKKNQIIEKIANEFDKKLKSSETLKRLEKDIIEKELIILEFTISAKIDSILGKAQKQYETESIKNEEIIDFLKRSLSELQSDSKYVRDSLKEAYNNKKLELLNDLINQIKDSMLSNGRKSKDLFRSHLEVLISHYIAETVDSINM